MIARRVAPLLGVGLLAFATCGDDSRGEPELSAAEARAAMDDLRLDVRAVLGRFSARIEALDARYEGVSGPLADRWASTRAEMRRHRHQVERDLAKLDTATHRDASRLKQEIASDLEELSAQVERAHLDSFETGEALLGAARDRLVRLDRDLQRLGRVAEPDSDAARVEGTDALETLRSRAAAIQRRLDELADGSPEEIAAGRQELVTAISSLTASVERELFALRQDAISPD